MKLSDALLALKVLQLLFKDGPEPFPIGCKRGGICGNFKWSAMHRGMSNIVQDAIRTELMATAWKWPRHSGNNTWPVPEPFGGRYYNQDFWEGEYGDNRRELLAFLIKDLKRRIKSTKAQDDYKLNKDVCVVLRKVVRKEIYPDYGLCHTIEHAGSSSAYDFFAKYDGLFESWPHFSGEACYPVGGYDNYQYHRDEGTLYIGAEGRARRSLARHLIKSFKQLRMDLELLP